MDVDPKQIIDSLAKEVGQKSVQVAALQAQLATVVAAYNELANQTMDVPETVEPPKADRIASMPIAD